MSGSESDGLILAALARLEAGQAAVLAGVDALAASVAARLEVLAARVEALEASVARLEAGQTAVLARVDALEAGMVARVAALEASVARLEAGQAVVMARIDRVQDTLNLVREDMTVTMNATGSVRQANQNTRDELRALNDVVAAMQRQYQRLKGMVLDMRGAA